MLSFNFPEKGLGLVSPPHFVDDFSRKMFLVLYSITDQISSSGCDVIKFEINLILLIKPFYYMTKKSKEKLKYLTNE